MSNEELLQMGYASKGMLVFYDIVDFILTLACIAIFLWLAWLAVSAVLERGKNEKRRR